MFTKKQKAKEENTSQLKLFSRLSEMESSKRQDKNAHKKGKPF